MERAQSLPFRRGDDMSFVIVDINLPGIKYWHKYCFTGAKNRYGAICTKSPSANGHWNY
ncbi:hypothetical protein KCP71_12265 [Salmonella enterica subsp. enterica]|nr:hypothetical protein KCP71_12265 [Salmonella enterica subsp. enterica]